MDLPKLIEGNHLTLSDLQGCSHQKRNQGSCWVSSSGSAPANMDLT